LYGWRILPAYFAREIGAPKAMCIVGARSTLADFSTKWNYSRVHSPLMYSTMPSPLLVVCTSVFVVICLAIGWAMLRATIDSLKSSTSDSPPPRCSHCHLALSNASARYCQRCGADQKPALGIIEAYTGKVNSETWNSPTCIDSTVEFRVTKAPEPEWIEMETEVRCAVPGHYEKTVHYIAK
jgi:hypothetical protein